MKESLLDFLNFEPRQSRMDKCLNTGIVISYVILKGIKSISSNKSSLKDHERFILRSNLTSPFKYQPVVPLVILVQHEHACCALSDTLQVMF